MTNEVEIPVKTKDKTDVDGISDKIRRGFKKAGDDSSKSFGSSVKRWFSGEGGGLFAEVGKSGGTVFGSGLLGALKTPILGPLITGALLATVATVMPAIGAVAAGGLVTAFAAGLAGLGIAFAAKSEAVKKVWSSTMSDLGADMRLLSRPFEATLINIAGFFRRTVDAFNPHLAKAFETMAGPIEDFADEAMQAMEQLIPAIDPITNAFNGVLKALGPALTTAVGNLSSAVVKLADSVAKNPQALADVVEGVGSLAAKALGLITTLNNVNTSFSTLTGGLSIVDGMFGLLEGPIIAITASFGALNAGLTGINAVLGRSGESAEGARLPLVNYGKGLSDADVQAIKAGKSVQSATEKLEAQRTPIETLITSMSRLSTLTLTMSNAEIGFEAAVDAATASIKDNGKNLDINTEKGRANRTALNSVAEAANRKAEAMLRAGRGAATAAVAVDASRRKFVTLATQMGMSKTAAERLASQLIAIPNVTRTAKLQAQKNDLDNKLRAAKQQLADPDLTRTRRAQITANITALTNQIAEAQRRIDALRGKSVTIRSRFITERIIRTQTSTGGGHGSSHASGGFPTRGFAWVGEQGPELAKLPVGTRIHPAGTSRQIARQMSPAAAAARVVLELRSSGSRIDDFLLELLRKAIKNQGGNVQVVLGR